MRATSDEELFETHDGAHWPEFYMDYSITHQKRFFDDFLTDAAFDWDDLPSGQLQVRRPCGEFGLPNEVDWPIP